MALALVAAVTTADVLMAGPLTRWDRRLLLGPSTIEATGAWHAFWRIVVMGGQFWLVGSLCGLAVLWAASRYRSWWILLVSGTWMVALNVTLLVFKHWTGRPAPHSGFDALYVPGKVSYPSGHAAIGAACMFMIAVLLTLDRTAEARRRALYWALSLSAMAAVATVMLGYHWPTDSITGYALGVLFGLIGRSALLARGIKFKIQSLKRM